MAGSAAVATTYLLVEHAGPWGRKALAESRFAEDVRHGLAEASDAAGRPRPADPPARSERGGRRAARLRDVRRPGRAVDRHRPAVRRRRSCSTSTWQPWPRARRPGSRRTTAPLYLVCTNGRRDLCCAEKGRPIVTALAAAYPDETWETTHVGGHRFAGAMLVLPHGLSYGRLDADSALAVVERSRAGELDLAHLRGRSAYDGAVQAAEIAARERLGEPGSTPHPAGRVVHAGVEAVDVRFAHESGEVTIRVEKVATRSGPPVLRRPRRQARPPAPTSPPDGPVPEVGGRGVSQAVTSRGSRRYDRAHGTDRRAGRPADRRTVRPCAAGREPPAAGAP